MQQQSGNPYTKANVSKIEMAQRRGARFVLRNYNQKSSVMLDQLGWKSLHYVGYVVVNLLLRWLDRVFEWRYLTTVSYNNNNKLYFPDFNKVLQYCKSHLNLIINYFLN